MYASLLTSSLQYYNTADGRTRKSRTAAFVIGHDGLKENSARTTIRPALRGGGGGGGVAYGNGWKPGCRREGHSSNNQNSGGGADVFIYYFVVLVDK